MKMPIYYLFLCLSIFLFISCAGPTKVKQIEKIPEEKEISLPIKDPYFIETIGVVKSEGPKSIVRSSMQDSKGNIWLSTWEGIIEYDGKSFINHTNKEGLRRFHAFSLLEDSKGNLWFGTIGGGAYKYDGKTWINYNTLNGLIDDNVLCFYEDNNSNIWIGTMAGINVYDGQNFRTITSEDGLPSADVNSIVQDDSGLFWVGVREQAFTYDGKNFDIIKYNNEDPLINVRSIIKDTNGAMWLGGNDGLWKYQKGEFSQIATNFHGQIYEDTQKNIWTSSEGKSRGVWEIALYENKDLVQKIYSPIPIKTEEGMFFGINCDLNNDMWFCNLEGVYRFDGMEFENFHNM